MHERRCRLNSALSFILFIIFTFTVQPSLNAEVLAANDGGFIVRDGMVSSPINTDTTGHESRFEESREYLKTSLGKDGPRTPRKKPKLSVINPADSPEKSPPPRHVEAPKNEYYNVSQTDKSRLQTAYTSFWQHRPQLETWRSTTFKEAIVSRILLQLEMLGDGQTMDKKILETLVSKSGFQLLLISDIIELALVFSDNIILSKVLDKFPAVQASDDKMHFLHIDHVLYATLAHRDHLRRTFSRQCNLGPSSLNFIHTLDLDLNVGERLILRASWLELSVKQRNEIIRNHRKRNILEPFTLQEIWPNLQSPTIHSQILGRRNSQFLPLAIQAFVTRQGGILGTLSDAPSVQLLASLKGLTPSSDQYRLLSFLASAFSLGCPVEDTATMALDTFVCAGGKIPTVDFSKADTEKALVSFRERLKGAEFLDVAIIMEDLVSLGHFKCQALCRRLSSDPGEYDKTTIARLSLNLFEYFYFDALPEFNDSNGYSDPYRRYRKFSVLVDIVSRKTNRMRDLFNAQALEDSDSSGDHDSPVFELSESHESAFFIGGNVAPNDPRPRLATEVSVKLHSEGTPELNLLQDPPKLSTVDVSSVSPADVDNDEERERGNAQESIVASEPNTDSNASSLQVESESPIPSSSPSEPCREPIDMSSLDGDSPRVSTDIRHEEQYYRTRVRHPNRQETRSSLSYLSPGTYLVLILLAVSVSFISSGIFILFMINQKPSSSQLSDSSPSGDGDGTRRMRKDSVQVLGHI